MTSGTSLAKELVNTQIIHENVWQVQKNATSFRCSKVWGPIRWPESLPDPRHPARSLLLTTPTMTHTANYKVAMIKKIQDGRKKEESVIKKVDMCLSFNFSKNLLLSPALLQTPPTPSAPGLHLPGILTSSPLLLLLRWCSWPEKSRSCEGRPTWCSSS